MKKIIVLFIMLTSQIFVAQSLVTNLNDWSIGGNVTSLNLNAGVLEITPSGGNFPTINYLTSVDATIYKYVRVLVRNQSTYNQIRFRESVSATATTTSAISYAQSVSDGFTNYYIDLTSLAAWDTSNETGSQIRFSFIAPGAANTSLIEIKEIEFIGNTNTTIWNGTAWSNGIPDATKTAIIASGTFNLGIDTNAYRVIVQNGATLNVQSGFNLILEKEISCIGTGQAIFRVNSSLLQNDSNVVNSSNFQYRRNSQPMILYDFTYWSSPVSGQQLASFSPDTDSDKFFTYNTSTLNWVGENPASNFIPGKGYAIRAPETYNATPTVFNGIFNGIPNNGNYSLPVYAYDPALVNYNFLGNPYPSALDTRLLIDNSSLETIYYWTHNTGISASGAFSSNDYAARTRLAGTAAVSGGTVPGRYMAAGQGFFARSLATGNVNFTNSMRVLGSNAQFFKGSNAINAEEDDNLIRLDLNNPEGAFKQQVLLYITGATDGYDSGMDGEQIDGQYVSFYSIIPDHKLTIQAKGTPWEITDTVPLGFRSLIPTTASFTISISELGIFFQDKNVYLEDTVTQTFHDLRASSYNFTSGPGEFTSRFVLHYQNNSLSNLNFELDTNNVLVYKQNNNLNIDSKENISKVEVFDYTGRTIYLKNVIETNKVVISDLNINNQVIIVKTYLDNGIVSSLKVLF